MSLEAGNTALAGHGYEIVSGAGLTVEEVLALSPEVVVTEATPSDLSCCELITQLKSQTGTRPSLKVVMIAHGRTQNVAIVMSQLASQHLIRPITTQGHIGDVLKDKIVYDAATTSGGSGEPLFNRNGKVIGINVAVIKDFGGSNLAVPARYATDLLR